MPTRPRTRRGRSTGTPALFDWHGPAEPAPSVTGAVRLLSRRSVVAPRRATGRFVAVATVVVVTLLATTLLVVAAPPVAVQVAVYAGLVLVLSAALRRLLGGG
jgi:hypothetical protein